MIRFISPDPIKGVAVEYRVLERLYGPEIRFNDWLVESGLSDRGGGNLLLDGDEAWSAVRNDYPYGGGGDVAYTFRFLISPKQSHYSLWFCVNDIAALAEGAETLKNPDAPRRGIVLFIESNQISVRVGAADETVVGDLEIGKNSEHTLQIASLDERYLVRFDDEQIASGNMKAPFTDNEGWTRIRGEGTSLRLIEASEDAIASMNIHPRWERHDELYRETFDPIRFSVDWMVNREAGVTEPTVAENSNGRNSIVFHHMTNAFLRESFDAPIVVDYLARPVPSSGHSSGVTDAIFIWMADIADDSADVSLDSFLERNSAEGNASLRTLVPHPFYWVDFGGTNNVTTRLRKNPNRHLMRQYTDRARLLAPDRIYSISTVANGEFIEFYVDGEPMIEVFDPHPHRRGHVGVRAYVADLEIFALSVHRIRS